MEYVINLRDVNADVTHHVIDALEASTHLVNCDHKAGGENMNIQSWGKHHKHCGHIFR